MKVYRNAARTKQWIRRALTELMAEKKDINKITVTELAQHADISRPPFTITMRTFAPWRRNLKMN